MSSIDKYYEPLTSMHINKLNLDQFKKKLKSVYIIPNNMLKNLDIHTDTIDINEKKKLYYERIETYISRGNPKLLSNLISINKSKKDIEDRKKEYNNILRIYNKSIKNFKDKYDNDVVVKLIIDTPLNKTTSYFHYYNYKIHAKENTDKKYIMDNVDDFILKNLMYGLYINELLIGFLIIKTSRKFNVDFSSEKIDTFYIQEVYIDKNYRERRLATLLLQYAILICPINKKYISLITYESNPMLKLSQLCCKFILQQTETKCPVNKKLLIRKMEEEDFKSISKRLTPDKY
jgi:ribosomal protein S18 acetylase RimI-like enzyme